MLDKAHLDKFGGDIFLDRQQFCDRLRISKAVEAAMRKRGDGPPFIKVSERRVIYRQRDVEEWLAARTFRHTAAELAAGEKPRRRTLLGEA